jgi:hypothetical protein
MMPPRMAPAAAPMPAPAPDAAPGPYAMVDDLVRAVIEAKGGDAAMLDTLPPLDAAMIEANPALGQMLADAGMAPAETEEAVWDAMAAEGAAKKTAAPPMFKPCADCPDPEACEADGACAMAA